MSQPAVSNQNLCDYCHLKPKFSNHKYCGRTCSAQASGGSSGQQQPSQPAVCKQCQKKPVFQNFDFCGKHCATAWKSNPPAAQPLQPQSMNQPQTQATVALTTGVPVQHPSSGPKVAVPPASLAMNMAAPVAPPVALQQQPVANSNGTVPLPASSNAAVPSSTGLCVVPGCGKQAYTAAGASQPSDYCSTRHREEAVTLKLVKPCILCNKLPRGNTDHFCSKLCRDTALAP